MCVCLCFALECENLKVLGYQEKVITTELILLESYLKKEDLSR